MSDRKTGRPALVVGDRTVRKVNKVGGTPIIQVQAAPLGVDHGDYALVIYEADRIIIMKGHAPDHTPAD